MHEYCIPVCCAAVTTAELEAVLVGLGDPPTSPEEVVQPDSIELAALELGRTVVLLDRQPGTVADAEPRPPVVTVMGHVDHGKVSIHPLPGGNIASHTLWIAGWLTRQ
jgi:hypothetical protein